MKKSWFTITKMQNNIYSFAEFSHWEKVVSYLIVDRTKAFLIDTGMGYESIFDQVRHITTNPITILLTHSHWDHIGGVDRFDDIWLYDDEFEHVNLKKGFISFQIPEIKDDKYYSDGFQPKQYSVTGKHNSHKFRNNQKIYSDSFVIDCIHTPGHTPGSVCFFIEQYGALFTGDTLYPGPLYAFLPESNWRDYVDSIRKLKKYIHGTKNIFPGHNSICENNSFLTESVNAFENIPDLVHEKTKELKFDLFSFILRQP